ncbi:MAG: hypothetical protein IJX27_09920 [Clostridia bacterium]|nr:hypothetical protein [Clostridia bacterium]
MKKETYTTDFSSLCVAVCGELPTACDHLLSLGIVKIDKFTDAVNLNENDYDLILVYAPQGEGLMSTWVSSSGTEKLIPLRLLAEPPCHSALVELNSKLRRILKEKSE